MNNVHERPAGDGLPAVIVDDKGKTVLLSLFSELYDDVDDEDTSIATSSGEYEVGMARDGQGIPPLVSDDEDFDDDDALYDCEDSGYESSTDDDSDSDGDGSRPASRLVRPFPPDGFWQEFGSGLPSFAGCLTGTGTAAPQQPTVRSPLELPGLQVEPREVPSVFQRWDGCAPSTSALRTSAKRRREGSDPEEVSSKRRHCEEGPKQTAPLTSGLSSKRRSKEEPDTEEVSSKRQRWNCEEPPEESVPLTSGLGSTTSESLEEDWDSAPSTSTGLRYSCSRSFLVGPFAYRSYADDSDSDSD